MKRAEITWKTSLIVFINRKKEVVTHLRIEQLTSIENIERQLLGLLQSGFPLTRNPFTDLGSRLGIEAKETIRLVQYLKDRNIVRQIGPILDARKLGYQSTLAGLKIPSDQIAIAEQVISAHPGVSHGYQREHEYNFWITLSVLQTTDIEIELEKVACSAGAETAFSLPALKVFKLRAVFGTDEKEPHGDGRVRGTSVLYQASGLSETDRLIINKIQQDLPLVESPFSGYATDLDMDLEDFLSHCQSLLDRGIMRRFGAAINHTKVGYKANAMTCWVADPKRVIAAGKKLAAFKTVSHCYERQTNSYWKYNLFAMIHGETREDCLKIAEQASYKTGLFDSVALFSNREIKKTRIKYRV
jgi:DNA-binding Lrp family transcriptional regulator